MEEEPDAPLVSLIIVSWNSGRYLSRCLDCIASQRFQGFEIIIIDNGSTDNSISGLEERYSTINIRVERQTHNLGFAAANNLGARLARGKWLVLLNADAFPEPGWLEALVLATENSPDFSAFSSRQLQADNLNILDGTGDAYHVSGMAWRLGLGYPSDTYGLKSVEVFSPCAAAAMYLREAFLKVGGFDESFFSYYEDVDLGFRLQLQGYRCLYVPQAVVYHVGSSTFGVRSDFAFYYSHRNLIWTYVKNMPSPLVWLHLPQHILANLIYLIYYSLQGRGKVLLEAKYDGLRGLPGVLKKRALIQQNQRVTNVYLEKIMEHGWLKPYLLGFRLRRARSTNMS
jgi:GT2 family glycosyltransferase